jgi:hypothetical protein
MKFTLVLAALATAVVANNTTWSASTMVKSNAVPVTVTDSVTVTQTVTECCQNVCKKTTVTPVLPPPCDVCEMTSYVSTYTTIVDASTITVISPCATYVTKGVCPGPNCPLPAAVVTTTAAPVPASQCQGEGCHTVVVISAAGCQGDECVVPASTATVTSVPTTASPSANAVAQESGCEGGVCSTILQGGASREVVGGAVALVAGVVAFLL